MKPMNKLVRTLAFTLWTALLCNPASSPAQDDKTEKAREERKEKDDQARDRARDQERKYQQAVKALHKRHWDEAIEAFNEVIEMAGARVDGAWYWKAYAQNKRGQREEALSSLAQLIKAFPESRWLSDAKALQAQIRQS